MCGGTGSQPAAKAPYLNSTIPSAMAPKLKTRLPTTIIAIPSPSPKPSLRRGEPSVN